MGQVAKDGELLHLLSLTKRCFPVTLKFRPLVPKALRCWAISDWGWRCNLFSLKPPAGNGHPCSLGPGSRGRPGDPAARLKLAN